MDPDFIIAAAAALLIALLFLWPRWQARRLRRRDLPGLESRLPAEMRGKPRLLLYFWSPSCVMCRAMTPVVQQLARERDDVLAIDLSAQPELARELGIRATPSLVLLEKGRVSALKVGAQSGPQIRKLLGN